MTDKGLSICNDINNCDFQKESQLASDINELYSFVLSDASLSNIDTDFIKHQIDNYYRTKRIKTKDETGEKIVEKIKVQRKGFGIKRDIKQYNKKISDAKKDLTQLEALALALEKGTLDVEQLALCDDVLRNNRIKSLIYKIGMAALIILIVFAVVTMIYN